MPNLTHVDGDIEIEGNEKLQQLTGLAALVEVAGVLRAKENPELFTVGAVGNSSTTYHAIRFERNAKLNDLVGLKGHKTGSLSLYLNPSMNTLGAEIEEARVVSLTRNNEGSDTPMANVAGLPNTIVEGGQLSLNGNYIESLTGFGGRTFRDGGRLRITVNTGICNSEAEAAAALITGWDEKEIYQNKCGG